MSKNKLTWHELYELSLVFISQKVVVVTDVYILQWSLPDWWYGQWLREKGKGTENTRRETSIAAACWQLTSTRQTHGMFFFFSLLFGFVWDFLCTLALWLHHYFLSFLSLPFGNARIHDLTTASLFRKGCKSKRVGVSQLCVRKKTNAQDLSTVGKKPVNYFFSTAKNCKLNITETYSIIKNFETSVFLVVLKVWRKS